MIYLALRKGSITKFKIPFKSLTKEFADLEVDFQFVKTSALISGSELKQSSNASPIEFILQPSSVKISNSMHSFLNVAAKFKNSYQLRQQEKSSTSETFSHLLIGSVKDTKILFSYVVQVSIIDSPEATFS